MSAGIEEAASLRRSDFRIDLRLARRLARLFVPFWTRAAAWPYWIGMALILAETALTTALALRSSFALKDMTNGLVNRDGALFRDGFLAYALLFAVAHALPGLAGILGAWITRAWRIWLTTRVLGRYLGGRVYYDIARGGALDNPDQRIQDSLSTVVAQFLRLPAVVLGALGGVAAGSAVLGGIDGSLAAAVAALSLAQAVATYLGYVPLVRLRYLAAAAAGDLRHGLARIGAHAEAIAFHGGEAAERVRIAAAVDAAVRRDLAVTLFRRLVTDVPPLAFGLVWLVLPYLILAPRLFAGEIDVGTLTQGMAVATSVAGATGALLGVLAPLSGVAPHAVRVAQLVEHADALAARAEGPEGRIAREHDPDRVAFDDLRLETPGGERRLVQHLTLTLGPGESLLIAGETGIGKSSLLRAMAGLWTRGGGRVTLPSAEECLFLPQRPYVTAADLRAQLLYPRGRDVPDADLLAALAAVRLPDLAADHGGLGAEKDWGRILSLGEQQRLAFARILITRPRLVLLDEATSAVDLATEEHLYRLLAATGVRFVSVGHRAGLAAHHGRVLTLLAGGGWTLSTPGPC
ncbi:ABC transporter ATP-binding protein/permease [Methylobacterium sp. WSM2598]|uniref:ABC transporter ATP-binding protein/permease n=1 Tax=Methylobacterium sp. WSM2598 TaxID=398261 RepID=UPI000368C28C|nr:ATP-binding cassette domain-containing protein [Methylobacterium sp. WSM2598]